MSFVEDQTKFQLMLQCSTLKILQPTKVSASAGVIYQVQKNRVFTWISLLFEFWSLVNTSKLDFGEIQQDATMKELLQK